MKKEYLIVLALVGIVLVSGCIEASGNIEVNINEGGDGKEVVAETDTSKIYYFDQEGGKGKLVVDKSSDLAELDIDLYLDEAQQTKSQLNQGCKVWSLFFNKELLGQMGAQPLGELETIDQGTITLSEFTFEEITMNFYDKVDKGAVAKCKITGYGEENIKTTYYQEIPE